MPFVIESSTLDTVGVARRLECEGWRAHAPVYTREIRHARRVTHRNYPLYSRYLFAWFDPDDTGKVMRVRGVAGVLMKAGCKEPSPVDDRLIGLVERAQVLDFKPGDLLQVRSGKMEGLRGLFDKREGTRVFLLLSMLGQAVPMDFHVSQLIKSE